MSRLWKVVRPADLFVGRYLVVRHVRARIRILHRSARVRTTRPDRPTVVIPIPSTVNLSLAIQASCGLWSRRLADLVRHDLCPFQRRRLLTMIDGRR